MEYNQFIENEGLVKHPESLLVIYKMFLAKEKQLYKTINLFKIVDDKFYGFFWAPEKYEGKVLANLHNK